MVRNSAGAPLFTTWATSIFKVSELSARPATPPAAASSSASESICQAISPRPAPSAARMASSFRRSADRASSRLAALAMAISRTMPVEASRMNMGVLPTSRIPLCPCRPSISASLEPRRRSRPALSNWLALACSSTIERYTAFIGPAACALETPGLSRATRYNQ